MGGVKGVRHKTQDTRHKTQDTRHKTQIADEEGKVEEDWDIACLSVYR